MNQNSHAGPAGGWSAAGCVARRWALLLCVCLLSPAEANQAAARADDEPVLLEEIVVTAGPYLVAPTRRDRIGRIWAPVFINGEGPFRLVLDSGASHSGVTAQVARSLGLPLDQSPPAMLRGATGSRMVPMVEVDRFEVGDLRFEGNRLAILDDPMGGADGILGTNGFSDRRVFVDFRRDRITIARSENQRTPRDYIRVPFERVQGSLMAVEGTVGRVRTTVIIDTGAQVSVANLALRDALRRRADSEEYFIHGVTGDVQRGEMLRTPPVRIGSLVINVGSMTFSDLHIFEFRKLDERPVMLIGMDALGLLDILIIDYHRSELQLRLREDG